MSSCYFNPNSLRLDATALLLLHLGAATSALYMVQRYTLFPFAAEYRLMLYALLTVVTLGLRRKLVDVPRAFWALGAAVVWIGIHTYWVSDLNLAIHATSRFANVLVLAPMAAVLLLHARQLEKLFHVFLAIFMLAMATLLFQYWGGELESLTLGYIAIRGDLVRHMTVVGEPNVGGMLAALVFVLGVTLPMRRMVALLWGSLAVAFVFFSLSKAAILGLGVGLLAGSLMYGPNERLEALLRAIGAGAMGVALMWVLGADDYIRVGVDSVLGGIRGEPSIFEDMQFRQSSIDLDAIFGQFGLPIWVSYLLGASFFSVGSAALEIRGPEAGVVLPHNSYLELFLAGGGLMLVVVLFLMIRAGHTLFQSRGTDNWPTDRCALICLTVLAAWMLVYPVIYEPVIGSLFWVIVGYGNRRRQPMHSDSALLSG